MGIMIFPGEKVKQYLPPLKNNKDIVGQFGAWLTQEKVLEYSFYTTYFISAISGIVALYFWVRQNWQEDTLWGVISAFIAIFIAKIGIYLLFGFSMIIVAIIGLFGCCVCHNKWTLITTLFLMLIGYFLIFQKDYVYQILQNINSM